MQSHNGRGAWHLHVIHIYPIKAPFIPNDVLYNLWQQNGWVSIKSLKDINNVGVYLTSYLCNLDISKLLEMSSNNDNKEKRKSIIKGQRLKLYPINFRLYRTSKRN